MRRILKVAGREYRAIVKTKMFLAILVLAPIMMSGGLIAAKLSERTVDTADRKLIVIDRSGVIADEIIAAAASRNASSIHDPETGRKVRPAYIIEVAEPDGSDPVNQRLELSNRVRTGEIHAFLDIGPEVVHPRNPQDGGINYYGQNTVMDDMRGWLENPINNSIRRLRLEDAGVDVSDVPDLFVWQRVNGLGLVTMNENTGELKDAQRSNEIESVVMPMIMMMFMYFMLMLVTQSLLGSVMEEKTQRIAEVLLGSVRPFEFMMGKLLGGLGVAFTAIAVYLAGGYAIIMRLGYSSFIPYDLLPLFFLFMALGIFMYGAFAAALGSLANDMKDAQSLAFPAMLPLIFSLFLAVSMMRNPSGAYAVWVSLIPIFTPMVMMFRMASPDVVPLWQQIAGIGGVLLFALFSVWAGGRVFRVGLLVQGKMPKLRNVVKWAVKG